MTVDPDARRVPAAAPDTRQPAPAAAPDAVVDPNDAADSGIFARIREAAPRLSPAKLAVAEYIVTRIEDVAFWPAARLAEAIGVSESVVLRLAGDLGYDGYPELQHEAQEILRQRLHTPLPWGPLGPPGRTTPSAPSSLAEVVDRSFRGQWRILAASYGANAPESLAAAATMIVEARRTLTVGMRMGHALAVAAAFNLHLLLANVAVVTLGSDTLEDSLRGCGPDDVAILFDFQAYNPTMERVVELLDMLRVRRIAVTDSASAPITEGAEVVLRTPTEVDVGAGRSLVGALALLDALAALVWELDPTRCRASVREMFSLRMGALAALNRQRKR